MRILFNRGFLRRAWDFGCEAQPFPPLFLSLPSLLYLQQIPKPPAIDIWVTSSIFFLVTSFKSSNIPCGKQHPSSCIPDIQQRLHASLALLPFFYLFLYFHFHSLPHPTNCFVTSACFCGVLLGTIYCCCLVSLLMLFVATLEQLLVTQAVCTRCLIVCLQSIQLGYYVLMLLVPTSCSSFGSKSPTFSIYTMSWRQICESWMRLS